MTPESDVGGTRLQERPGRPRQPEAPPLLRSIAEVDVKRAAAVLGNLGATLAQADASFSEDDFAQLGKSVKDLVDEFPVLRALTRIVRFMGGIGDLLEAGRKIREGRELRKLRQQQARLGAAATAGAASSPQGGAAGGG